MADSQKPKERTNKKASSASAQAQVKLSGLEKQLDEIFVKKAPWQLPKGAKDWLVKYSPWIALASGLLGLWAAWSLWQLGHYGNDLIDYANRVSKVYGSGETVGYKLGFFWWVSIITLAVQSVLQIVAFSGLQARRKAGWNLLFYSALLSVVVAVVYLFIDARGFGSFIGSLVGSSVGLYILFQIRSYYTKKAS